MRVRSLHMNDAHLYVTEEQFEDEFLGWSTCTSSTSPSSHRGFVMRLSLHSKAGLARSTWTTSACG